MSKQLNKNCRRNDSPYIARNHELFNQLNVIGQAMARGKCSDIGLTAYGVFCKENLEYLPGCEGTFGALLHYANDKISRQNKWISSERQHEEMRKAWETIIKKIKQ